MGGWAPDPSGAVLIHASAVNLDGEGLVFLGPNKTGKSTMRELLSVVAEPIADDRALLFPEKTGQWMVTGGDDCSGSRPWVGAERAVNGAVPLRGVFRLHQATEPVLVPLSTPSVCHHLTHAFLELLWQQSSNRETMKTIFARTAAVARAKGVRGYGLHFDCSNQTVELILRRGRDAAKRWKNGVK